MDSDLMFAVGVVIALFSFPAMIGAYSESRPPRAAAIAIILGGGLIALAAMQKPGGYAIGDIPEVMVRVLGRLLN